MAGTRSSARLASQQKSSPPQSQESPKAAGSKRKLEASVSPSAKRGRKTAEKKEQKTIEDTMDVDRGDKNNNTNNEDNHTPNQNEDSHTKDNEHSQPIEREKPADSTPSRQEESSPVKEKQTEKADEKPSTNGDEAEHQPHQEAKAEGKPSQDTSKMDDTGKIEPKESQQTEPKHDAEASTNGDSAVEPHARDEETPSSILEKGVIYFFFRGRVGIDDPSNVGDIARTYIVLRPIPHGAKIGEGPIGDASGKCRLLALPKKVLPLSGKDKFMTFVEKSNTSFKELKDEFMSGSDYGTQTAGVRHTPPVTPVAEGVYALTTTGRESHLAYMITIPQELGQVQKDMGIKEQGSFITSAKNPQYAGPANTNLPEGPGFPKELLDEFRGLRWAPLQPKLLDYENTQFLLIGESSGLEKATEQQAGDNEDNKEDPKEELEKLEGEDEIRIKDLKGDDAVFADLGISKKEYPSVPSTWSD